MSKKLSLEIISKALERYKETSEKGIFLKPKLPPEGWWIAKGVLKPKIKAS